MRCTSCGLPLSPARTMKSCPRCGTSIGDKKSPSILAQQPFPQSETWRPVAPQTQLPEVVPSPKVRPEGRDESGPYESDPFHLAGAHVQSSITNPPASPATATYMPQSTPKLDPMWLPTSASVGYLSPGQDSEPPLQRGFASTALQSDGVQGKGNKGSHGQQPQVQEHEWTREQLIGASQAPLDQEGGAINRASTVRASQRQSWQPRPPKRSKNNLGFIVAGLCVITGGLILVFVYFMALGSPGNSNSTSTVKTNTATNSSPVTASSPASSPTATPFPGQKYIDHAQLASSIDPTSHQAIQITTTFKANQRIYITFQLHPNGQSGAACLLWYANNKEFFPYALPVYSNERTTYSYASYSGTGSGYVEIYWASTTLCADKILAQHVNFTVTS